MKVRAAKPEDMGYVVDLAEQAHAQSPHYSRSPFNREKVAALGAACFQRPEDFVLLVAEHNGHIIGYIIGLVAALYYSDAKQAASISLYVDPAYHGTRAGYMLLREFEAPCRERGAKQIQLGASVEAFAPLALRLYKALGYTVVGTLIVKYLE